MACQTYLLIKRHVRCLNRLDITTSIAKLQTISCDPSKYSDKDEFDSDVHHTVHTQQHPSRSSAFAASCFWEKIL